MEICYISSPRGVTLSSAWLMVPEFEGEEAWFEIQNIGGGVLSVLRQVEPPGRGRR